MTDQEKINHLNIQVGRLNQKLENVEKSIIRLNIVLKDNVIKLALIEILKDIKL